MSHFHVYILTLLSVLLISCQTCNSTVQIPGYYDSVESLYTHDNNSIYIDPYALRQSESIDAFVETDVLMKEKKDSIECSNNANDNNTSGDKIKEMDDTLTNGTTRKVELEHKCERNIQKELNDIRRSDATDLEKWNRWKRRVLHAERDRERRTKQDLQRKAKSSWKEWYVPSTDLLQPYKIAHRAVMRTQRLLSDSLNVHEYLADLLQSARTLRTECEKMFVESSFQTFTEKKLSLRDDSRVKIRGSTGNNVSTAGDTDNESNIINDKDDNTNDEHNGESDSDISVHRSDDGINDDNGKLRFIGELQEWYEHALMNRSAKQYNTSRLQWKVSSILFFPSWMYKTLATYLYDATHVLPDSFVAYSTVLQAAKREGHLLSTSLELIQHRLPELEAQRQARLERERKESMNEEESENRDTTSIKTDDDDNKNNKKSNNSTSDTQNQNVSKEKDYKDKGKNAAENKEKKVNTEIVNGTPINYEVATKPIVKEISKELLQTDRKVNAVALLHYELWHLSRSHMTHMKEAASLLESQIQEAIISNDESTTAKRKELKVLVKLRSRLHTWNEQMQEFSQKNKAKEVTVAMAKTKSLQSLMFGESFANKWSWLIRLFREIGRYFTKHHLFDKQNKSDNTNVWLDSSEAEMALAMIARYRLGTETNWEFLDKAPSPHWLTTLTGLLPNEFTAIYTAPFATTLCLSVMLVALLAYAKSKIIHSIAVTIMTCQKKLYEDKRRAKKTNNTKSTSTNMTTTTTIPASTQTSTNKEDNTHESRPRSSHKDNEEDSTTTNNGKNESEENNECANSSSGITSISPHTSCVTPEQALRKRRKWMRVVKVLTIVQQFTPVLLFLCLSYMSAVQQIYSTMVFFALILPTQRALNICVISAACLFLGCTAMKFNEYLINKYTQATRKMFDEQKKYN